MSQALNLSIDGEAGDRLIKRICKSNICNNHERLYSRLGITPDKNYYVYSCERCDELKFENIKPEQRTRFRT